tara:strand:+ start:707 stop:1396 length:690 start_codon:yes stop_codon:yes gene_type:complete
MLKKHKILIIEDELELAKSTVSSLKENGFLPFHAKNLKTAKKFLRQERFTAVLLDLGLPDGDGISLIKEIKSTEIEIGLIIVSAKDVLEKKVQALELGADDYLTKPFFFSELNARLKSVIRRFNLEDNQQLTINEITLFPEEMRTLIHGKIVDLTGKEFGLLLYFFSNPNRVISKTTLGEFMTSSYVDYGFTDDLVYTHIKNLKKKITNSGGDDYIKNVYGVGYKFTVS